MFLSTSRVNGRVCRRFRHGSKMLTQRWANYRPSRSNGHDNTAGKPTGNGIGYDRGDLHATMEDILAYRSRRAA